MTELTDVITLETDDELDAIDDLRYIFERAIKFKGTSERAYLRKLWDGESWLSIKDKLNTEGSIWYVWFMDGVRAHLNEIRLA